MMRTGEEWRGELEQGVCEKLMKLNKYIADLNPENISSSLERCPYFSVLCTGFNGVRT